MFSSDYPKKLIHTVKTLFFGYIFLCIKKTVFYQLMPDKQTFEKLSCPGKEAGRPRKSVNILTPGIEVFLKKRGFQVHRKEPCWNLLPLGPAFPDE